MDARCCAVNRKYFFSGTDKSGRAGECTARLTAQGWTRPFEQPCLIRPSLV